ncbi:putative EamA domain-containing protein [Seiridium unicorne]|uniref:EamA domain-containing protein n=1 Tax=Seiridium unicorne TaxID=138068 RepID=A0ABR2V5E3_9PEZI
MASTEPFFSSEAEPEIGRASRRSSEPLETPMEDLSASFMSRRSVASSASRKPGYMKLARRTLGLACLLVTVFLWTASNFLASYIFSDHTYDKPFFVVYVNTSMFAISMIPISIKYIHQNGGFGQAQERLKQAWREKSLRPFNMERLKAEDAGDDDLTAGERLLVDDEGSFEAVDIPKPVEKLGLRETAWLSLEFCMLWFFANYFASACLQYTSVGSVTILTSTSSVWTLVFCAWMKVEPFSVRKLIGVMASLAGIILISLVDLSGKDNDADRGNFPHKTQQQIAIGDLMALISAVVYGLYVTVMKVRVGDEDRVSMPLFFGLVGIINVLLLWPVFFILHFTGMETFELPPTGKVWIIILLNSISSFISDMSWAYAMLLTTPLIVTVGLSLTIPLSLIGEMIQYQQFSSFLYWVGAGIVLLSFLFINHESHEEPDETAKSSGSDTESRPLHGQNI